MNIEETMKFMLKGVENHTENSEILEKLKKVQAEGRPLRIKLGLDPSAPDIHLGHAVVLRKIKQLQDLGHEVVIIIGDFTGMIGDPSGKSKTRKQLTREEVEANAKTYQEQIFKILNPKQTTVRYNSEWLGKMTFREVIELCAKSTVARLLERDDFQNRYTNKQPIAVHEFFYPFMQAYDSVAIRADVELGGTDQTFNILMGRNIQKDYGQDPQITLFMPLLEGTDGVEKMSKSLGNYIGVYEDANTMYTKVMKVPDNLIIKYYELCTDIHPDKIDEIKKDLDNGKNPRDVKMDLAREITALYHNEEEAKTAEEHFKIAFQEQKAPDDIPELFYNKDEDELSQVILDLLMTTGKFASKGDLRRLFMQGGVKVDGEKVTDVRLVTAKNTETIFQVGKGNFYKITAK